MHLRSFGRALAASCLFSMLALAQPALAKAYVVVSVDWEGRDLQPANLRAMSRFREDYPQVPLQHFLNAAYYTKPGADARATTAAIRSVLRDGDEHGLHVHAWRSLVTEAGVAFRTGPSFVDRDVVLELCGVDCGNDVALTSYTVDELRRVLRFSVDTLVGQGFGRARSFRAGGWMADRNVLTALALEGFTLDSSATDSRYLEPAWGDRNLPAMVEALWPTTTPVSSPYRVALGDDLGIIELPNNGCLSDYVTGADMLHAFVRNAAPLVDDPARSTVVSIGFHQETAAVYLPHLRDGIDRITAWALQNGVEIEFLVGPF
jgi:hypothetical protein